MPKAYVELFLSKKPDLIRITKAKISLGGIPYTQGQFRTYINTKDFFMKYGVDCPPHLVDAFINEIFTQAVKNRPAFALDIPYGPHNCRLFRVINEGNERSPVFLLLEKTGDGEFKLCEHATAEAVIPMIPKQDPILDISPRENFINNAIVGHIDYRPYEDHRLLVKKLNFYVLNSYHRPIYMREWDLKTTPEIPTLILKFLNSIFLHKRDVEIFLDKAHFMTKGRCFTWPLLISNTKGVGKSLLKKVMAPLFGSRNVGDFPRRFFRSDFDPVLKHKTLIWGDEISAKDDEQMDNFKRLIEPELNIHMKYENAVHSTRNHANFIFTSNFTSSFKIDSNERRLWIPDIRETPLDMNLTEAEIEIIASLKEGDSISIDFCRAIANRVPKYDKNSKLLSYSETQQKCVTDSLATYEKELVERLLKGENIEIESFVRKDKRKNQWYKVATTERVINFIKNYRHILEYGKSPKHIATMHFETNGTGHSIAMSIFKKLEIKNEPELPSDRF
ncbi:MAG: primase-helicase family protein [Bacteriovoracales bacterium]